MNWLRQLRVSKGRIDPEAKSAHYSRQRSLAAYAFTRPYVSGRAVLDAGCGAGHGSAFIAGETKKLVGVDLDLPAVTYSAKSYRLPSLHFLCADLLKLPFPSNTFDIVISFQVVEHLRNLENYFQEVKRVLKQDGTFFLATLNRTETNTGLHPDHTKEYAPEDFCKMVTSFFPAASFYGLFGNERYLSVRREEARWGRIFLKMDPWGVRRLLPHSLWEWFYAFCTRCVNSYVSWRRPIAKGLSLSDFQVREASLEKALDFIAVCRKG